MEKAIKDHIEHKRVVRTTWSTDFIVASFGTSSMDRPWSSVYNSLAMNIAFSNEKIIVW